MKLFALLRTLLKCSVKLWKLIALANQQLNVLLKVGLPPRQYCYAMVAVVHVRLGALADTPPEGASVTLIQ
jgi:hypothetical protein